MWRTNLLGIGDSWGGSELAPSAIDEESEERSRSTVLNSDRAPCLHRPVCECV